MDQLCDTLESTTIPDDKGAPNRFPISRHFIGSEFSCKHCGVLKVESRLLEALDVLADHFGKPDVVIGYLCYEMARKRYSATRPSSRKNRAFTVPMHLGKGFIMSWEYTSDLVDACDELNVQAIPVEEGTLIALPPDRRKRWV